VTREESKALSTPRDPGLKPGGIRERVLRAAGADMSKVYASMSYWRQRTSNGEIERWEKLAEQKRINDEVAKQEEEQHAARLRDQPD
jgi:hypothetical protein